MHAPSEYIPMPGNATHPCPSAVEIREVGPRDGLQNEARHLPTAVKIECIDRPMAVERNIHGRLGHASQGRPARAVSTPRTGHAPR
jgi:hypothetical protein